MNLIFGGGNIAMKFFIGLHWICLMCLIRARVGSVKIYDFDIRTPFEVLTIGGDS